MKHAHCKNIHISFNENNHLLQLHLEDDGKGFDINAVAHKGIGLSNIKKRAEIIGGKYTLESGLGKGTKLTIEIPNNK
jgi:signal transduction histidine kinase